MNAAYLHLLINHFPVILSVVGAGAALLALFSRHRSTWTFALTSLLLAGLTVYPAFFTGEGAEHVMEKAWYIDRKVVHAHEAAAEWALWVTIATGVIAAFAMWRERTAYTGGRTVLAAPTGLRAFVAVAGLMSAATLGRAAWTSKYIVHLNSRILEAGPAAAPPATETPAPVMPMPAPTDSARPPVVTPVDTSVIKPPVR